MTATREILKGKSTNEFKDMFDYQEAVNNKALGPIYIGSLQGVIGQMRKDIDAKEDKSEHFGKMFCPERPNRPVEEQNWSYEKNMAFMAGAIDAGRSAILTTKIENYCKSDKEIGITPHEILWLADNGYTFSPNPGNPEETIAKLTEKPQFKIKPYQDQKNRTIDAGEIRQRIRAIRDDVLEQRRVLSQQQTRSDTLNWRRQDDAELATSSTTSSAPKNVLSTSSNVNQSVVSTSSTNNPAVTTVPGEVKSTGKYIPPGRRGNTQANSALLQSTPTSNLPTTTRTATLTNVASNIPSVTAPTVSMRQVPLQPNVAYKPHRHQK